MKQLYYITFKGRYEMKNGKLSTKQSTFTVKDSNTYFHKGKTVIHNGRFFHIDQVFFEPISGYYQ